MESGNKRKLLFVVRRMNVGGVQKSLLSVLNVLDYERFDVTLYVREDKCELLPKVDPRVIRVIVNRDRTRYYRKPYAVFLYVLLKITSVLGVGGEKVKAELDRYVIEGRMRYEYRQYFSDGPRYDIAVSYFQGYTAKFVEKYVTAERKIVFYHGSVDERHALHEEVFPAFDRIVAVNAGCRDVLRSLYPDAADKICYIENCVDAGRIRSEAKLYDVNRPEGITVLCTCGRFSPEKGFDLALEAAKTLKENGVSFLWYFVGDGPDRIMLEKKRAELGLNDDIVFTGLSDNPYPYIDCCDIYVQPSREESYGLAIAEAQILGKPVVTTATVGGKSLVSDGKNGLIARVSAESLAEKISDLIENRDLYVKAEAYLRQTDYKRREDTFRTSWDELLHF
ncbi:MAG: glycosyltransferase [Clostridia bacterium]|nr:glycosyltransferase [Clostridia bacterium]